MRQVRRSHEHDPSAARAALDTHAAPVKPDRVRHWVKLSGLRSWCDQQACLLRAPSNAPERDGPQRETENARAPLAAVQLERGAAPAACRRKRLGRGAERPSKPYRNIGQRREVSPHAGPGARALGAVCLPRRAIRRAQRRSIVVRLLALRFCVVVCGRPRRSPQIGRAFEALIWHRLSDRVARALRVTQLGSHH
jgi:hypothetical protein